MSNARHHIASITLLLALGTVALTVTGCRQEDMETTAAAVGKIELTMSAEPEVYIETRSTQLDDISTLDFTLSGQTTEGQTVSSQPITFTSDGTDDNGNRRFAAVFEAGTYTLTASTKAIVSAPADGPGAPAYSGTSSQFVITQGSTAATTIDLGAPVNAKITVELDATFSAKYELPRITITDGTRSVTITDAATAAASAIGQPTFGLPTTAYFGIPASGTLSYSIVASARSGSHVTDITGTTGAITLSAGCQHTLTLTATPVSGKIIPIVTGQHNDEFD